MTDIIFVKTRSHYPSYIDFWRLVKLSGFNTCYIDQVDITENCVYIVSPINAEWERAISKQLGKYRKATLILWDLERPAARGGLGPYIEVVERFINKRLLDEIWVSDKTLADETNLKYIILGSHEGLGKPLKKKSKYDICHLMYMNNRRKRLINSLQTRKIAPSSYKLRKRDKHIRSSLLGLSIHQDNQHYLEPLRLALFAAYGLPTISENVYDSYPFEHGKTIILSSYNHIPKTIDKYWADYAEATRTGLNAFDLMCNQFSFQRNVEMTVWKMTNKEPFLVGERKLKRKWLIWPQ